MDFINFDQQRHWLPLVMAGALSLLPYTGYGQPQLTSTIEQQRQALRLLQPQRLAAAKVMLDTERASWGLTADDTFEPASTLFTDDGTFLVRYNLQLGQRAHPSAGV